MKEAKPVSIICAEDDDDHYFLLKSVLEELPKHNGIYRAEDGEELLEILMEKGVNGKILYPSLILLDLNMPRKDGFEVLKEIRENPEFKRIPVIVLTVSESEKDITKSYELGANCFITKPSDFKKFHETVLNLYQFWVKTAKLPSGA